MTSRNSSLTRFVTDCRRAGKRLVVTNGCFDVLHAGHVLSLSAARRMGDALIVLVNSDNSVRALKGDSRPVNSIGDRLAVLRGLRSVDFAVEFRGLDPTEEIKRIRPDVLVKGADWRGKRIAGAEFAGEVRFVDLLPGRSTTAILAGKSGGLIEVDYD